MLQRTQRKLKWDLQDNVTDDTKGFEVMWDLQDNATEDTKGIEVGSTRFYRGHKGN